jgi:hypothetical protein
MTHPHPRPFTVSNWRYHRRQRTLAVMLVVAGTVACGGESPVSPDPQAVVSQRDMKAPTSASYLLNYLTPYDAALVEVQNMNTEISAEIVYYWGAGTLTPPQPTPIPTSFSSNAKKGGKVPLDPTIGVMYIPAGGCSLAYIDCVYECLYLREVEWRQAYAEFMRAEDEFFSNIKDGKHYLNQLWGGPQDRMQSNFYQMVQVYRKFKQYTCKKYIG